MKKFSGRLAVLFLTVSFWIKALDFLKFLGF